MRQSLQELFLTPACFNGLKLRSIVSRFLSTFPFLKWKVAILGVFWNFVHRKHFHILRKRCVLCFICSPDSLERKLIMLLTESLFNASENRFLVIVFLVWFFFCTFLRHLLHKDCWVLPLEGLWCFSRVATFMHTWGGFLFHVTGKLEMHFLLQVANWEAGFSVLQLSD